MAIFKVDYIDVPLLFLFLYSLAPKIEIFLPILFGQKIPKAATVLQLLARTIVLRLCCCLSLHSAYIYI